MQFIYTVIVVTVLQSSWSVCKLLVDCPMQVALDKVTEKNV